MLQNHTWVKKFQSVTYFVDFDKRVEKLFDMSSDSTLKYPLRTYHLLNFGVKAISIHSDLKRVQKQSEQFQCLF